LLSFIIYQVTIPVGTENRPGIKIGDGIIFVSDADWVKPIPKKKSLRENVMELGELVERGI